MASIHKHKRTTLERIDKFLSKDYYTDINLRGRLYSDSVPLKSITHWALPGSWKDFIFTDIVKKTFTPVAVGQDFGPLWSTHWFKTELSIPKSWVGKEVHLIWNSESEAMVWSSDGEPLQGLSGSPNSQIREEFVISKNYKDLQDTIFYIEVACLSMFGAGKGDMISEPDLSKRFTLQRAEVAVFDRAIFGLSIDLELMHDMAKELGDNHSGFRALYAGNEIINILSTGKTEEAKEISKSFFANAPPVRSSYRIIAMGHCHIDSAWLWTYDETMRKCARSWSAVAKLMEEYPELTFTCSQAQQFAWVEKFYPSLFKKITGLVRAGKFIPVGGTWVEMDGNLPSGESFIRQFLLGQTYFQEKFGVRCKEFWLPDTFGYSAQIPQIMKHVGIDRFLTQKLSWNLVNAFPHHSFWWEGIDGSSVLVHFPPGDDYASHIAVKEVLKTEKNCRDKGRSSVGALLFGYGDGGGGPTSVMIERQRRLHSVEGMPNIDMGVPDELFSQLALDGPKLCRWTGELYLELHNATYTSQAAIKWWNRHVDFLLHECEFLLAFSMAFQQAELNDLPRCLDVTKKCWEKTLLNQFHDVLPGSSIGAVYDDAIAIYKQAYADATHIKQLAMSWLTGSSGKNSPCLFNSLPWTVKMVLFHDISQEIEVASHVTQKITLEETEFNTGLPDRYGLPQSFECYLVEMPPCGITSFDPIVHTASVCSVDVVHDHFIMDNRLIRAEIDKSGRIVSLVTSGSSHDAFKSSNQQLHGNQFVLFDDMPLYWEAWDVMDYHLETRKALNDVKTVSTVKVLSEGPLASVLLWSMEFGKSRLQQWIVLRAESPYLEFHTHVNWQENRKFLKVEFPINVLSRNATYDIQFGHLERPTHRNTSWDEAKFEVCGHKWVDLSETGWGMAIFSDCKYGWGAEYNTLRLSLLRAPKRPDPKCDIGQHRFSYALHPHTGSFQEAGVIQKAYEFNYYSVNRMELWKTALDYGRSLPNTWIQVEPVSVILETVKPAEKYTDGIVIRMYESFGGHANARIHLKFPAKSVVECNGMEDALSEIGCVDSFEARFSPFEIRSFLIKI